MLARRHRFARNELIFREGDECGDFYLIISGRIVLEIVAQGIPLRILTLGAGDELGWSSLLEGSRRQFQARAMLPVNVLAFGGQELQRACDEDPAFGYALLSRLMRAVAERLDATRIQLLDMYSLTEPAR